MAGATLNNCVFAHFYLLSNFKIVLSFYGNRYIYLTLYLWIILFYWSIHFLYKKLLKFVMSTVLIYQGFKQGHSIGRIKRTLRPNGL